MAGAIDPSGLRGEGPRGVSRTKLRDGWRIETQTEMHAIIVDGSSRERLLSRVRGRGAGDRYVVSVDEQGQVTMIHAEPIRS